MTTRQETRKKIYKFLTFLIGNNQGSIKNIRGDSGVPIRVYHDNGFKRINDYTERTKRPTV